MVNEDSIQFMNLWFIDFAEHFKKALDMMNRAVNGPQSHQPGAMEQVSYLTSLERTQPTMSQMPPTAQPRMEVRFSALEL